LIFHRVVQQADPLLPSEITGPKFAKLLDFLKARFSVMALGDAWRALQDGTLPPGSISITFDDGYQDNYTEARALLVERELPATFFIATAYLDGGRMWNDTVFEVIRRLPDGHHDLADLELGAIDVGSTASRATAAERIIYAIMFHPPTEREAIVDALAKRVDGLPDDLMMTSEQVKAMRADGMEIGGHTRTHPILEVLDDDLAFAEIRDGKSDLESILEEPVTVFAYPNGKFGRDFSEIHQKMVQELEFDLAVSTNSGVSRVDSNAYRLPRFTPWGPPGTGFSIGLLRNRFGWV
jgi:peptidoglycan/xylan/chitin deacetylase (PgdA/CDA1 family)